MKNDWILSVTAQSPDTLALKFNPQASKMSKKQTWSKRMWLMLCCWWNAAMTLLIKLRTGTQWIHAYYCAYYKLVFMMVVSFYFVAFICHTLKAGLWKYCLTVNLGAKKGTTDLYMWTIYDAVCVQGCKYKGAKRSALVSTFLSLKLVERRNKWKEPEKHNVYSDAREKQICKIIEITEYLTTFNNLKWHNVCENANSCIFCISQNHVSVNWYSK